MLHLCKICRKSYSSPSDFELHFQGSHKLNSRSTFACGVELCSARFCGLKRYESHLAEIHAEPRINSLPEQNLCLEKDGEGFYKCAVPSCNYKSKSKTTLRSHKHRNHTGLNCRPVRVEANYIEQEVECGVDFSEESVPQDTEDCTNVEKSPVSREDVVQKFVHFFSVLNSKFHVSDLLLQYIIEMYSCLLKESNALLCLELVREISRTSLGPDEMNSVIESCLKDSVAVFVHDNNGPLRSAYIRHKEYKSHEYYVPAKSHNLQVDSNNKSRRFHTVSIGQGLQALFQHDSVYEQYVQNQTYRSSIIEYRDIFDGSLFRSISSYDPSSIVIQIYNDDLELCNPLGGAKAKHKVSNFYISVGNLHPWSRSKPECVLLALTCREKDVSYFGLPRILEPFINELHTLERDGVLIRGKKVKVKLMALLGDNLGMHTLTGFLENFSRSVYFCRYCEEQRSEWQERWYGGKFISKNKESEMSNGSDSTAENSDESLDESGDSDDDEDDDSDNGVEFETDILSNSETADSVSATIDSVCDELKSKVSKILPPPSLRTCNSYDECAEAVINKPSLGHRKGVVSRCEFNKLDFHCVGRSPPCLPHDLFEGVIPNDLSLALEYLCNRFKMSLEYINRAIRTYPLQGTDRLDRPPKISEKFKISGNAVQNWVLLRFLPLIVGNQISDTTDLTWQMVLLLQRVVQMLTSPVISRASLPILDNMIRSYLYLRSTLFPECPLRPKHHYMEHYPQLIKIFGPLMRMSTLDYERKHMFFKRTIAAKKCFKNITKTLANEHQLMMSAQNSASLVENLPIVYECHQIKNSNLTPPFFDIALSFFGPDLIKSAVWSNKVKFRGTQYSEGKVLVLSAKKAKLEICLIKKLFICGSDCYAVGMDKIIVASFLFL